MCTSRAASTVGGVHIGDSLKERTMNAHTARSRRSLAALAAGGILTLATALPATAVVEPGIGGGSSTQPRVPTTVVDDDALEYIQISLGVVGGIALAGAGAAAMRARRQRHPQLA